MRGKVVVTALLAGLSLGCRGQPNEVPSTADESSARRVEAAQEFELRIGQTASIGNAGVTVHFEDVRSDSRCAEGVQCVWAGDAEVALRLARGSGEPTLAILHTGIEPREATFGEHRVQFVGLRPTPRVEQPIPRTDYVARLIVMRR